MSVVLIIISNTTLTISDTITNRKNTDEDQLSLTD